MYADIETKNNHKDGGGGLGGGGRGRGKQAMWCDNKKINYCS